MEPRDVRDLPRIPTLEADYRLVRILSQGRRSTEFLARERATDRLVRIRVVPAPPSDARQERPPDPALALARLDHPGIAVLLGTRNLEEHGWALIFQQPSGGTLEDRLREGAVPVREAERILTGVATALAHAHARGVVHGSLHPSTIHLEAGTGQPRLAGFGIDGSLPDGGPGPVDDVRALGRIGWEMLTGELPGGPAILAERCPGIPRRMRAAIEGALDPIGAGGISDIPTFISVLRGDQRVDAGQDEGERDVRHRAPPPPSPSSHHPAYRHPPRGRSARAGSVLKRLVSAFEVPILALLVAAAAFVALHPAPAEVLDSALSRLPVEVPWSREDPGATAPGPVAEDGSGEEAWTEPASSPAGRGSPAAEAEPGSNDTFSDAPGDVVVVGGRSRLGAPGRPLRGPIVVRVVDDYGVGVEGVEVAFEAASGGGRVDPARAVTGPGGAVSVSWTLGPAEGTQVLTAEVGDTDPRLVARISAEADPGMEAGEVLAEPGDAAALADGDDAEGAESDPEDLQPTEIEAVGPTEREISTGDASTEPLEVRILDSDGRPVAGVPVRFRVTAGGGETSPELGSTDDEGRARAIWRFGQGESQAVQAVVEEFPSLSVEFSARAGAVRLSVRPEIRAGGTHSCWLDPDGRATCWGANESGQLGEGPTGRRTEPGPSVGASFTRVATGVAHTCGITASGEARCWGLNDSGQLGDGTTSPRSSPVSVPADAGLTEIAAGASHTCGLAPDGTAHCWGANDAGQLGDGSRQARTSPVIAGPAPAFRHIVAGWRHTCALDRDGAAFCWGANEWGQAGVVGGTHSDRPRPVLGGHRFTSLAAGNAHTCGVTDEGRILCWGGNDAGQLGDGTRRSRPTPGPIGGAGPFVEVTAGGIHSCGRTAGGEVHCWGGNLYGQLGDGSTSDRTRPVAVAGGHRFSAVHALGSHTCGRTEDGRLLCWGYNLEGQIGDGTRENRLVPTPVRR